MGLEGKKRKKKNPKTNKKQSTKNKHSNVKKSETRQLQTTTKRQANQTSRRTEWREKRNKTQDPLLISILEQNKLHIFGSLIRTKPACSFHTS